MLKLLNKKHCNLERRSTNRIIEQQHNTIRSDFKKDKKDWASIETSIRQTNNDQVRGKHGVDIMCISFIIDRYWRQYHAQGITIIHTTRTLKTSSTQKEWICPKKKNTNHSVAITIISHSHHKHIIKTKYHCTIETNSDNVIKTRKRKELTNGIR